MVMLVLLSVISIFIIFIIIQKHITNNSKTKKPLHPPGPPPLPLIGNLHQLNFSSLHHSLRELSNRYGPLMSLQLGFVPTLVVSSSKMAREVLKTHDLKFASRPSFVGPGKFSYYGLDLGFSPYSPYWREMKKLCTLHLFSYNRVQSFRPIREHEVVQLIRKISLYADSGKVVNLTETLMSFTNSLICKIAFGKNYGCDLFDEEVELGSERRSRLQVLLNEAQALFTEFYFSDYFPLMGWVDRLRGILSRLDRTFKELDAFYERVIKDHMDLSRPKTNDKEVADITDIFLELLNDRSSSFDLTLDHIKAVLMNIFIAGTDPTSATIVWAMTALLKNPSTMNKLQREVTTLFSDKDFINEEDIERLPYLKAVVKETLRLFPPSPLLLPRETMEKCNIDGYEIEPRTLVYVNAWAIARDSENWEEPEEFKPERFLESAVDLKGTDFEVIPFGAGRRMCPAKHMGMVNVEVSVANLVHAFDWELPNGTREEEVLDTQVKPGVTMHKKNDLYLVAKKRTT